LELLFNQKHIKEVIKMNTENTENTVEKKEPLVYDPPKTDKKKVSVSTRFMVTVVIVFLGLLTGYFGFMAYDTGERMRIDAGNYGEAIKSVRNILSKREVELSEMKKKMASIKDQDDLLIQDIELYIETTHPKVPMVVAKAIAEQTVKISMKHNVSAELIIGIIKVESSFNPMAVGSKTKYGRARGLMQVMPEWVKKLNIKSAYDLHNIDVGIDAGIKVFLIHLDEAKGDISTGLYKYVNHDKAYVAKVYEAMGKLVAFRSTVNESKMNVDTDIETNGYDKAKEKGVSHEQ